MYVVLYVSRYKGFDRIGVVDSDTGRERFYSRKRLGKLADTTTVAGAKFSLPTIHSMSPARVLMTWPYQALDVRSTIQVKTNFLRGVEVIMYGSMITYLNWDERALRRPCSIRFSEFGDSCGDFILAGRVSYYPNSHLVTIILDDNVRISDETFDLRLFPVRKCFRKWSSTGVVLDVREITSERVATRVYRSVFMSQHDLSDFKYIIDSPERMSRMKEKFESWKPSLIERAMGV